MIYILSGIAKAGKSLISNEIRDRYNISVFSTDYIMMMLYKGNSDLNVDKDASDSSVSRQIEPYVYGLIETMIENNSDYLIEGVHFNTPFARKLLNRFGDKIRILYIGYKDISVEDKVNELNHYKDQIDNTWIFDLMDGKIEDTTEYLIEESKRVYNECMEHNLDYIDIYDINKQKEEVIQALLNDKV